MALQLEVDTSGAKIGPLLRCYLLKLVLVGTTQVQIFGHRGRGDPATLRGEMIGYRFPAAMSRRWYGERSQASTVTSRGAACIVDGQTRLISRYLPDSASSKYLSSISIR